METKTDDKNNFENDKKTTNGRRGRPRRTTQTTTQTVKRFNSEEFVLNLNQKKQKSNEVPNKWSVGQRVEARDVVGNWYSAKIIAIDSNKVLVHFERWSSRYDQWFELNDGNCDEIRLITSNSGDCQNSRPMGRDFELNEEVLARWNDSKLYPATIIQKFEDQNSVLVLFYDGYRKKVKFSAIEKMPVNYGGIRIPEKNLEKEFRVRDDHNEFKCHFNECQKGFRKQSLLFQHLKHYHNSNPIDLPQNEITSDKETEEKISKRKYVRKQLPLIAVRKSNRQLVQNSISVNTNNNQSENHLSEQQTSQMSPQMLVPNTTLPFWDARTIAEIHENDEIDELVHCICPAREESGLMVQCECCLCWQHAYCMSFDQELDVPQNGYFCFSCRFPKNVRKSQKNSFLLNHFIKYSKRPEFQLNGSNVDSNAGNEDEKEFQNSTYFLLSACFDSKEVLKSTNSKINKNENEDEIKEKQKEIFENLSSIESKIEKMEKEFENEFKSDSEVKKEIFLLFNDLKNAKSIVSIQ